MKVRKRMKDREKEREKKKKDFDKVREYTRMIRMSDERFLEA